MKTGPWQLASTSNLINLAVVGFLLELTTRQESALFEPFSLTKAGTAALFEPVRVFCLVAGCLQTEPPLCQRMSVAVTAVLLSLSEELCRLEETGSLKPVLAPTVPEQEFSLLPRGGDVDPKQTLPLLSQPSYLMSVQAPYPFPHPSFLQKEARTNLLMPEAGIVKLFAPLPQPTVASL